MKKLIAVAVLALVSTSAQAKVHELKFGGRTARIEIPSGCKKISCIRVQEKEKASRSSRRSAEPSQAAPAMVAPAAAAAATSAVVVPQAVQAASPAPQAPAAARPEPQARQPEIQDDRRATARLSLPSAAVEETRPAAVPAAAPTDVAPGAQPKSDGTSPLGLWLTQKKEAKIRVVECGGNICGHVEGKPGEKVLINMKPGGANRWNGTIHDIRRGGNYSANIQLKGPDALKVTGCAFGGMFCGGETWTRLQ